MDTMDIHGPGTAATTTLTADDMILSNIIAATRTLVRVSRRLQD